MVVRRCANSCMQVMGHWRGEGVSISIINQGGPLGLMDIRRGGGAASSVLWMGAGVG